jgi:hypothetical protein
LKIRNKYKELIFKVKFLWMSDVSLKGSNMTAQGEALRKRLNVKVSCY